MNGSAKPLSEMTLEELWQLFPIILTGHDPAWKNYFEEEKALLEKYAQVKKHCVPPVARLYGDQCGGCNMSLPQVTLRKFKNDVLYIECENCGRMIIQ